MSKGLENNYPNRSSNSLTLAAFVKSSTMTSKTLVSSSMTLEALMGMLWGDSDRDDILATALASALDSDEDMSSTSSGSEDSKRLLSGGGDELVELFAAPMDNTTRSI